MTRVFFVAWVLAQLFATAAQIPVWRSEVSLWTQAAQHAPEKPRAWVNLGRALLLSGHADYAEQSFSRAIAVASSPHVRPFDREDAMRAAQSNLETVTVLRLVKAVPLP